MTPQSGELTLKIKRIVPAAPPVVFSAFSTPDELAQMVGAEGLHRPESQIQPQRRRQLPHPDAADRRRSLLPHRRVPRSRSARPPRLHVLMGGPGSRRRLRPIASFAFSMRTSPEEAVAKLVELLDDVDPAWRSFVKVWDGVRGGVQHAVRG
jgi:hypothetical protein